MRGESAGEARIILGAWQSLPRKWRDVTHPGAFRLNQQKVQQKILIVTLEPVSGRMAGPAIRSIELGRQLADEFLVTVYTPHAAKADALPEEGGLKIVCGGGKRQLHELAVASDILFIQANVLKQFP